LLHTSPVVQLFLSSHAVPLATFVNTQPDVALQTSTVHGLLSLQGSGVPPLQTPPWHLSFIVQRSLSLHATPSFGV
jgi:hypothetical protein